MRRIHQSSPVASNFKERVADYIARQAVGHAPLERAIVAACRNPTARRRLKVGAVAMAYARVLGAPEVRIAEFDGYRMFVNVAEHLGINPFFFKESGTVWPTRDLVSPGDACIDAGANVGHYTFFLATIVGIRGRVTAFEPNPPYSALIERSIALNGCAGRVTVDRRALWDKSNETMRFFVSTNPTNSGTSSLVDHGCFLEEDKYLEVSTITLDDYTEEAKIERLSLVKIDVERAEQNVLRGMKRLLETRRVDHLVVEMHAQSEAQLLLLGHGYRCYYVDDVRRTLIDVANVPRDTFGDYLAVSPDKQDALVRRYSGRIH
jgi:FkbM family methyltransferase